MTRVYCVGSLIFAGVSCGNPKSLRSPALYLLTMDPIKWLEGRRGQETMNVVRIAARECLPWTIDQAVLSRPDARYFTGFLGLGQAWISQPEIGTLGFLTAQSAGRNHILLQVKEEPGNTLLSQLAPTVQATKSNIDRVHGGADQPFLGLLRVADRAFSASETTQSEQGSLFWRKRNENVLREVEFFEAHSASHLWATFEGFRRALSQSHTVNTDARSVIAASDWIRFLHPNERAEREDIWTNLRLDNLANTSKRFSKAMRRLKSFRREKAAIDLVGNERHRRVAGGIDSERWGMGETEFWFFDIKARFREVDAWSQPLLTSRTKRSHKLVMTERNGDTLCLVRAVSEMGLLSLAEFGPSVSTYEGRSTASVDSWSSELTQFLAECGSILRDINQSDEGGRFYQQEANYQLLWVDYDLLIAAPSFDKFEEMGLVWVTLRDLNMLCATSMTTTNELRTLATLLLSLN